VAPLGAVAAPHMLESIRDVCCDCRRHDQLHEAYAAVANHFFVEKDLFSNNTVEAKMLGVSPRTLRGLRSAAAAMAIEYERDVWSRLEHTIANHDAYTMSVYFEFVTYDGVDMHLTSTDVPAETVKLEAGRLAHALGAGTLSLPGDGRGGGSWARI
ncbi:unnamed protein product, partial [Prorocentrum cordatum]